MKNAFLQDTAKTGDVFGKNFATIAKVTRGVIPEEVMSQLKQTFDDMKNIQHKISGAAPPVNGDYKAFGGVINFGGPKPVITGESNNPEILAMLPGNKGRVFSNAESRNIAGAFSRGDGGSNSATVNLSVYVTGNSEAEILSAIVNKLRGNLGRG